ncbi:hypothetical protein HPP92_011411 [Vanilla planifolia]|uniref:Uncharacterized protein n=1 Tax=Vanilla planifolia TaxID=51239 RepID=A0A835QZ07_VANPL|nr:hypothetical protein HPP92_011411 [Vanilla planifolia]
MGRSMLQWFCSSPEEENNRCQLLTADLEAFYCCLLEDLNLLEQSLSVGSISLEWSVEAMNLLKKVQVELLYLFKKYKLSIPGDAGDGWFNQYMQDSVATLDFCNSLKFAVSRIDRHRMIVDIAIQKLDRNICLKAFFSETVDLEKSESQKMIEAVIIGSRVQAGQNRAEDEDVTLLMLAAKNTTVVVYFLLISALVSPVSVQLGGGDLPSRFPQLKVFDEMLSTLVGRFRERASAAPDHSGLLLSERETVGKAMRDIRAQVARGVADEERFQSSVELLRASSLELKKGIEKFDSAVDDVFDVVIRGRTEMLAVLKDRDLFV